MIKSFFTSLSIGFFIGVICVGYFMGPKGIREQVCKGYVENAKPLSLSRAEKESYLESYRANMTPALPQPTKSLVVPRAKPARIENAQARAKVSKKKAARVRQTPIRSASIQ